MSFLHDATVFTGAAVLAVPVSRRLGLGSVLGYLGAGIVIGPAVLGLMTDVGSILQVSELGVVLLLFIIGLELQPSRLWALRRPVFGLGSAQVLATGAVLGLGAWLLGLPLRAAAVAGIALALSSTAFVLQVLAEKGQLRTRQGRASFAILLFQDLAAIPLIALIPLLGSQGSHAAGGGALAGFARALAVLVAFVVVGRLLVRPFLRMVAATRSNEIFTAAAVLVVVGSAFVMQRAGLSLALGAFLAGVLLADSEYRHELEADIEPFKGLLLGLFFIAVGMSVDLGLLAREPLVVAGLVLGLLALKGVVLYTVARLAGYTGSAARRLAVALAQGGEFAFVLFGVAVGEGVLTRPLANLLVVVVTLSMALTPLLFLAGEALERRLAPVAPAPDFDSIDEGENPVIIAGFGRYGQIVARNLRVCRIRFTALDASFEHVDFVRRFGNRIYYGDASRLELLRAARAEQARVLVLAVDDVEASMRIAELVRRHYPRLAIYARARNRLHAFRLMELGVTHVERETLAGSLNTATRVLEGLGIDARRARRAVDRFRVHDQRLLTEQAHIYHDERALVQTSRQAAAQLESLFDQDHEEPA